MTRQETGIIMDILSAAYPRFGQGQNMRNVMNLWAEMFAEDDVAIVAAAVKALIVADTREFPPLIGTVKEKIRELTTPKELTEAEAWALVSKAVRNSIWDSKAEFEKLPQDIRRLVGSPSQLREWATMDSSTLHSVVASNFQRSYQVIRKRNREEEKLPGDVRNLLGGFCERLKLEGGR